MFQNHKTKYYFIIILFIFAILIWAIFFRKTPDDILEVIFFDIGQGDSIFIETPNKKQILIDGGPDNTVLEKLGQKMSFWDRTIDLIILTHPDFDHITGLIQVLERFEIEKILVSGAEKDSVNYKEWQKIIKEKNIPIELVNAGEKIVLDNNIYLNILWPEQPLSNSLQKNVNNASVVARLVYNNAEFLLTGDIDKSVENKLSGDLESDVLKAGHHGSKNSNSKDFIQKVNPKISVISAGRDNYYNHPHPDALDRLNETLIYRTDKHGDIRMATNGFELKVEK